MTPGVYVLVLELKKGGNHEIGKLGHVYFPAGFYCYTGSALNGLEARLERHLSQEKKLHWHIDYLLKETPVVRVFYAEINVGLRLEQSQRDECRLARHLLISFDHIKRFGSSDCRCPSHLVYSRKLASLNKRISEAFRQESLQTRIYPVNKPW